MWTENNNELSRKFQFANFIEAWGFMSQVAMISEKMNHHPNWSNVYNQVEIKLQTHDLENTISEKDRKLAVEIDQIFSRGKL
jgi:4a-hydroxytetrahydrobiopterin dehydratase